MNASTSRIAGAAAGLLAIMVAGWLWHGHGRVTGDVAPTDRDALPEKRPDVLEELNSTPFAVRAQDVSAEAAGVIAAEPVEQANSPPDAVLNSRAEFPRSPMVAPELMLSRIGREALSDEDFESLVALLKADPGLLQGLIDEFRQEQDPQRQAELARLLGEAGGLAVTQAAGELIYSGDEDARAVGLALLQVIQPGNPEARDIVSGLLATEVEPEALVDALTSLARPGRVDTSSRAAMAEQVALLTSHVDPRVRGISLDILSRWSVDGRDTEILLGGLADSESRVREAAAFALVNHEVKSPAVIYALLQVVQSENEPAETRRAAILALRSMPLTAEQREQVDDAERRLDTVVR